MKEKYKGTENFVKEGTPPKEKVVKDESKDNVSKTKEKNKNKNGKVGINKHNNYAPDMYAPRKVCAKCGSANHLSIHCKINSKPTSSHTITPSQPLMPNLAPPNLSALTAQFASMTFMNPFIAYNMNFAMPWNMIMNNDYSLYASQLANESIVTCQKLSLLMNQRLKARPQWLKLNQVHQNQWWLTQTKSQRLELTRHDPRLLGYQKQLD